MPRFSRATTYAPPDVSYARTVWRYEAITIAISSATAIEIGSAIWSALSDAVEQHDHRRLGRVRDG